MVYDSTTKTLLSDQVIEEIAKRQIDGEDLPVTKEDWTAAIEERAEKICAGMPLSPQQKFSKAIGGSASTVRGTGYDGGDRLCRLYHEAMKIAPRAPAEKPAPPADVQAQMAKRAGPASQKMLQLADEHRKVFPSKTREQSYAAVYEDPANIDMKQKMMGENLAMWSGDATMRGDTSYMDTRRRTLALRASRFGE